MKKIKILIPVYDDWQSVFKLLEVIDMRLVGWNSDLAHISVIIINDGSSEKRPINIFTFNNLRSIHVINMKDNKGHARCIAAGLKYIYEKNGQLKITSRIFKVNYDDGETINVLIKSKKRIYSINLKKKDIYTFVHIDNDDILRESILKVT